MKRGLEKWLIGLGFFFVVGIASAAGNPATTLQGSPTINERPAESYSVSGVGRGDLAMLEAPGTAGPSEPQASCGGWGSSFVVSAYPTTVGINQPFTLTWCDPTFFGGDICYGVDAYAVFSRVSGTSTWYQVPPWLSKTTLSTNLASTTAATYELMIGVDGYACTIIGTDDSDKFSNIVTVTVTGSSGGGCTDNLSNGKVCLRDGRFELTAQWQGFDDNSWRPVVWSRETSEVALGTFQNNTNDVTMIAKMVWGCPYNNHYWFWLGGFTDAGWDLTVKDLQTGTSKRYTRSRSSGSFPTTIRDDSTFPCP